MIFISTASGERHVELARNLEVSFAKWNWPRLIVGTHETHPELDTLWKGRGLKTQFAKLIPDNYSGPVCFVDADCLAIGPYPGDPEVPEGGMSGLLMQRLKTPDGRGRMNFFSSCFMAFPTAELAREISEAWFDQLKKDKRELTDEHALHRVTKYLPGIALGWFKQPMENLRHLAETHPIE
jgi:hypothetical protein